MGKKIEEFIKDLGKTVANMPGQLANWSSLPEGVRESYWGEVDYMAVWGDEYAQTLLDERNLDLYIRLTALLTELDSIVEGYLRD